MKTIFLWLQAEFPSKNSNLMAINWRNFLFFPFSIYKINKFYFFAYLFYLYLFFCVDMSDFAKFVFGNQDAMIFFAIVFELALRLPFLPIILYFCIDKNRILCDNQQDYSVKNYQFFGFVLFGFLTLLCYDLGLIIFSVVLVVEFTIFVVLKVRTINLIVFLSVFQIALYIAFLSLFVRHENNFGFVYLAMIYLTILLIFFYDKFNTKDKKCLF